MAPLRASEAEISRVRACTARWVIWAPAPRSERLSLLARGRKGIGQNRVEKGKSESWVPGQVADVA